MAKVGRPTSYKQEYCEMLISHMEEGLSFEAFAGVLSVSKQTLYTWTEAHSEFMDAKRVATQKSRVFWERAGLQGMFMGGKEDPFNATVWVFNMKNRFNWRDRTEVKSEIKQEIKAEIKVETVDLEERLTQLDK